MSPAVAQPSDSGFAQSVMAPGDILGPASILIPPFNDIPVPFTNTGLVVAAGVAYQVTVTGTILFSPNPGYAACTANAGPPLPPLVPNPVGPAGLQNFLNRYAVIVGRGTASSPPSSAIAFQSVSSSSVTGFVDGPGVLWVSRPAVLNNACGNETGHNPGWTLSGDQSVQAVELEPPSITVDKERVAPGDSVRAELVIPSWITTYFVAGLGGWVWVPAPGATGTARFIEGCARTQTFCRAEVFDSGHFEVRGIVAQGAVTQTARSPDIAVGARTLRLTLTVDNQLIRPRIPDVFLGEPCGQRFPEISAGVTGFTVEARYSDGEAASGIDVTLETEFIGGSGGHDHQPEDRAGFGGFRLGTSGAAHSPLTARTDADGRIQGQFVAGSVGGFERLKAKAGDQGREVTDLKVVAIQIVGLQGLGASLDYVLIGDTDDHSSNHWGLPLILSRLTVVAGLVRRAANGGDVEGPYVIQVNDMSIENGGVFDLAGNFQPEHFAHNRGVDIDVSNVLSTSGGGRVSPDTPGARALSYDDLSDAVAAQYGRSAFVLDESTRNHYHIRFVMCPSN